MAKELISILEEAHQLVPPELLKWRHMGGGGGNSRYSRFGTFRGGRDFGSGGGMSGRGGSRFGSSGGDYRNGGSSSFGTKRPYDGGSSSAAGSSRGGYGGGASSSNGYSNSYGAAPSSSSNGYDSRSTKHTRFDD